MGEDFVAACVIAGLESSNEPVTREVRPSQISSDHPSHTGLPSPFQTAYFLGNLSNGTRAHQDFIFTHLPLLDLIHACMADGKSGVRSPLVSCVLNLLTSNSRRRQEFVDAGFVSTLRHLCDWTGTGGGVGVCMGGGVSVSPGGVGSAGSAGMGMGVGVGVGTVRHTINSEDDKEAAALARRVLDLMDACVIGDLL